MSEPTLWEASAGLVAANPDHQQLLDERDSSGTTWRCSCGAPLFSEDECAQCYGDDPYGSIFCPVEDFCCGC